MKLSESGAGGLPHKETSASARSIAGRDKELDLLTEALTEASAGRGRTVLIGGEPGIGKTTVAEAFSRAARDHGARVAWGRSWEAGGAPPYWPWIQALRSALAIPGVDEDLGPVRPFLDVVATLVPEVAGPGGVQKPEVVHGDQERFALFDAISRVVQAMGRSAPLVVVLDDLHAADESSLLLLRFVARDIRRSRCLVIGTYRDREVQADPVASGMVNEIAREGDSLTLEGLDTDVIASILQRVAGAPPSDALRASLQQITEGNPFYANEIMRSLLQEVKVEARVDLSRRAVPVPDNVSDLVLRRVRSLDPQVQALLRAAAVIGKEFSLGPTAKTAGIEIERARDLLATVEPEGILRSPSAGTYVFDHSLIRESLYESLSETERSRLHGEVAASLEEIGVGEAGEDLAEIAHHYLRAGLDDARSPFEYAVRAGAKALEVLAFEQAVELLDEALALASSADATQAERGELLLNLGEALLRAGKVAEGRERILEAADSATRNDSPDLLVRAAIAYGYIPSEGGIVNPHSDLIERALATLGQGDSVERALLMSRLGAEIVISTDLADAARKYQLTGEGLAMARRVGTEREIGFILRSRFTTIFAPDRIEECFEIANEMLEIGLSTYDPVMQIMGRLRRATIFLIRGQGAELDVEMDEAERIAKETREPFHLSTTAFSRAMMTAIRSDIATALERSDAALALGSEVPNALGAHLLQHVSLRWETDGAGDFEFFIRAVMEQRPGLRRVWGAALIATLARSGRAEEARTLVRDAIRDLPNAPVNLLYMCLLHLLTDALRILRDHEGAEVLFDALLPYRDQHMVQMMLSPVAYYGSAERDLGTLASLMERWDVAEEHFDRGLVEHARLGARTYFAWTQVDLADMLLRRGDPADVPRAEGLVIEALQTAKALGLTFLAGFAAPLLERDAAASPAVSDKPLRASFVREGEYVTITHGDEVVRLRHSKGLVYLAQLLASPGRELHVLEIASPGSAPQKVAGQGLEVASDDAGALLDPKAKAAYKQRIDELREDIEEAQAFNDPARAERAQEELDFIVGELSGAIGLGGRDRKSASNAERARVNVTKRIKTTMDKISSGAPKLGRHLDATIKTGTFLSYSHRIEPTLEWDLQLEPPQP